MDRETLQNNLVRGLKDKKSNIREETNPAIEIEDKKQKLEAEKERELRKEYEQVKFEEEVYGVELFDRVKQNGIIPDEDEWDFISFKHSRLTVQEKAEKLKNEQEQKKAKSLKIFKAPFPAFPGEK
jgi:hypothetical protein